MSDIETIEITLDGEKSLVLPNNVIDIFINDTLTLTLTLINGGIY